VVVAVLVAWPVGAMGEPDALPLRAGEVAPIDGLLYPPAKVRADAARREELRLLGLQLDDLVDALDAERAARRVDVDALEQLLEVERQGRAADRATAAEAIRPDPAWWQHPLAIAGACVLAAGAGVALGTLID